MLLYFSFVLHKLLKRKEKEIRSNFLNFVPNASSAERDKKNLEVIYSQMLSNSKGE